MNPLFPLRPLASNIKKSETKNECFPGAMKKILINFFFLAQEFTEFKFVKSFREETKIKLFSEKFNSLWTSESIFFQKIRPQSEMTDL